MGGSDSTPRVAKIHKKNRENPKKYGQRPKVPQDWFGNEHISAVSLMTMQFRKLVPSSAP